MAKLTWPALLSPSEPTTASAPTIPEMVLVSGPLMNRPSSEAMPNSAPTIEVIRAAVIPKPTCATKGPENSRAP